MKAKNIIFSFQLNPKEAKFIDEASALENRNRSNFILTACLKRAEKIFEISNKKIPDLSEIPETPEEVADEETKTEEETIE